MIRQRYRWEFSGVSWWSRAPSPAHGAEFHYTSNRPTVPCPPHSYAVTNLSIQNPFSFTAKKLPLCEPLLLGHCKTHIVRHTPLYTDKSFIPLPKIPPCQKLAGYVVILPAKLETKKWGGEGEIPANLVGLEWLGYINLVTGIPQVEATSFWEERYLWCCSRLCPLLEYVPSVQHSIMMKFPLPWVEITLML